MDELTRIESESLTEALFRLGKMKHNKEIIATWDDIADKLNEWFGVKYCESHYRKKWAELFRVTTVQPDAVTDSEIELTYRKTIAELEKKKVQLRAFNKAYKQQLREDAFNNEFMDALSEKIAAIVPDKQFKNTCITSDSEQHALYALLSDVHYGLEFKSRNGDYNTEIARTRIMEYAYKIVDIGRQNDINLCYVSLLGDLISGMIHQSLRIESTHDVIEQVMEIAEHIGYFLAHLCNHFEHVYVNSVSGNHSRIETDKKAGIRSERLDSLIVWYCKSALQKFDNITFEDNSIDSSIACFNIFGKNYIAVHGDFDNDMKSSVHSIQELSGNKVDYFVYGHLHVINTRFENVGYIGNGSVVSGGDDYTTRKRLFAPAMQIVMHVTENGVESLYPVKL